MRGAPLLFAAAVIGGWIAGRAYVLWPRHATTPAGERVAGIGAGRIDSDTLLATVPTAAPRPVGPGTAASQVPRSAGGLPAAARRSFAPLRTPYPYRGGERQTGLMSAAVDAPPPTPSGADGRVLDGDPAATAFGAAPIRTGSSGARFHIDAWLIGRPAGGENFAFGELGASQAGVRLTYPLGSTRRIALSARLSAPLHGRGSEGAVGIDWQPTRFPVHLLVEQRIPLEGGAVRPAAQLIAGVSRRLPLDARLDAYAQAGAVHRRGGFADGSVRLSHRLGGRFDLGVGAWGAAQRRVARLDIGPSLGIGLPIEGATVRAAVDYRLRIAGDARPGSGPAVSLGTSF